MSGSRRTDTWWVVGSGYDGRSRILPSITKIRSAFFPYGISPVIRFPVSTTQTDSAHHYFVRGRRHHQSVTRIQSPASVSPVFKSDLITETTSPDRKTRPDPSRRIQIAGSTTKASSPTLKFTAGSDQPPPLTDSPPAVHSPSGLVALHRHPL